MIRELDPAWGPFLFDTSAESWLARNQHEPAVRDWIVNYHRRHKLQVSAITVVERLRGYALIGKNRERDAYLSSLELVLPLDTPEAMVAAAILGLHGDPPAPPRKSHRLAESRASRQSRWHFDVFIAATALTCGLPLLHNNSVDFEAVRMVIETHADEFRGLGPLQLIRVDRIAF